MFTDTNRRVVLLCCMGLLFVAMASVFFNYTQPVEAQVAARTSLASLQAEIDTLKERATEIEEQVSVIDVDLDGIVAGEIPVGAVDGTVRLRQEADLPAETAESNGRLIYLAGDRSLHLSVGDEWRELLPADVLQSRVLNVTYHSSSQRRSLGLSSSYTLETIPVIKRSTSSILVVQASVSGFGSYSGAMQQVYQLGTEPEVVAQSITYTGQQYCTTISSTAVIPSESSGLQELAFRFVSRAGNEKPFQVYNPNSADDQRIGQSRSVYIIWEIEPPAF